MNSELDGRNESNDSRSAVSGRSSSTAYMTFGVDLISRANDELEFLEVVDRILLQSSDALIQNAVRRYEQCWLPLAARHDVILTKIAPPLDVHWVWHCHMLSPYDYETDCRRLVGKTIDHAVLPSSEFALWRRNCLPLWQISYPSEPFDYDRSIDRMIAVNVQLPPHESRCAYDLNAAVRRQANFFYQVSLPHYRSQTFLENAFSRYKMFLNLKKRNPREFLVPCYDIDIMWHTHQLHPLIYKRDCVEILGKMLNHDDTATDRNPDSELTLADEKTRMLWKELYGTYFASSGAMYRGVPSHYMLKPLNSGVMSAIERSELLLSIETGAFLECVMPENVEQLWGPIPLPSLPEGQSADCIAATHR